MLRVFVAAAEWAEWLKAVIMNTVKSCNKSLFFAHSFYDIHTNISTYCACFLKETIKLLKFFLIL